MKYLAKNILIAILVLIFLSGIFSLYNSPFKIEEIVLSKLVEEINTEQVKKITVEGQTINIELTDNTKQKTTKETETSITESLKNYGVQPEKLNKISLEIKNEGGLAFWLINLLPFILPFALIGLFLWFMFNQAQRSTNQAMTFTRSLVRMALPKKDGKTKTTFKDVAGLKEAKEELEEVVDFLRNPQKFKKVGARTPKGALLIGPPGTGKTLLARAVAGEAKVPFFHISGSEFVEMFVGVGASRVRDTFSTAKKNAPSILFIDELDAIGRQRGTGLGGGHDEREQTLNQILVEMDGFEEDVNVIVLAATNRPDVLDPALLRPGRFDRRITLDLPDINEREAILTIHAKSKPLTMEVNLRQIAERTPGFSGAELSNLMNEAAIMAARNNKNDITMEDLYASIDKVLLGPERRSHILSKKEKEITAYHEAGHALIGTSLPNCDPIRKISIIARGRAAGYTLNLPEEDRYFRTKSEFYDNIAMMLGGYVAEKTVFNELTTGSSNDLKKASELARKIVTQYGMSKLGPIAFEESHETVFLGRELAEKKNYSEKYAAQIDTEVESIIKQAEQIAENIIKEKRHILDKIANTLKEKETLEREEYEALFENEKKNKK